MSPSFTVLLVIVIVGCVLLYVQLNSLAAILLLPIASVYTPAPTFIVVAPTPDGVNVAV